jgi:hypothetical protein
VNTKKADILQIRKYLNGELDAKAMHKLEREALDDPFLMDAIEGFETAPKDQQANLANLTERLQQRIEQPKKGRVFSWQAWSIAASVLVILTIGGLWLRKTPGTEKTADQQLATLKKDKTQVELKDTITPAKPVTVIQAPLLTQNAKQYKALKPGNKSVYQDEISSGDNNVVASLPPAPVSAAAKAKEQTEDDKEVVSASEIVASNYTESKEKNNSDSLAALAKKAREKASAPTEYKLKGNVGGLTVVTSKDSKTQFGFTSINGIIIAKPDGAPVIGAAVRIEGTNKSTVTDVNGYFSMPASSNKQTLAIASIGYLPKQVSVKGGDSLKVELNPADGALNEVVVGYGAVKKEAVVNAHPQGNMSALKKYLQANAVLPNGEVTGTVSVTFTVNGDGSLSDFKTKKSLAPAADQKAIDLIKAGPTWVGNSTGKPEEVTVKVKFQQQK